MSIVNKKAEEFALSQSKQFFLGKKTNKVLYTDESIYRNLKNKDVYDELFKDGTVISIPNIKKFDRFGNVNEIDLNGDVDYIQPQFTFDQYGQGILSGREDMESQQIIKIIDVLSIDEQTGMMFFSFFAENIIKWNGIKLTLGIKNNNTNNFIQLDTCQDSLIKSLSIFVNDVLVEMVEDYSEIETLTNIIYERKSNYTNDNPLMNKNIEETLACENTGTSAVFNPTIQYKDISTRMNIKNGKIQLNDSDVILFDLIIKSKIFGNKKQTFQEIKQNLNPELVGKKITIGILLNTRAFFVPVFNCKLNDLMNVYIDGSLYDISRQLRKTKESLELFKTSVIGDKTINDVRFNDDYVVMGKQDEFTIEILEKIGNVGNFDKDITKEIGKLSYTNGTFDPEKPIIFLHNGNYYIQKPNVLNLFASNGITINHFKPDEEYDVKQNNLDIKKDSVITFNTKKIPFKENEKKFYDNWPLEIGEKLKIGDKPSIKRKADGNPKSKIFSILLTVYENNYRKVMELLFKIRPEMFKFKMEEIYSSSLWTDSIQEKENGDLFLFFLDYFYLDSIGYDIFSVYWDNKTHKDVLNYDEYKLKFIFSYFGVIDIFLDKNIDKLVSLSKITNYLTDKELLNEKEEKETKTKGDALSKYIYSKYEEEKRQINSINDSIFSTLEKNNINLESMLKIFRISMANEATDDKKVSLDALIAKRNNNPTVVERFKLQVTGVFNYFKSFLFTQQNKKINEVKVSEELNKMLEEMERELEIFNLKGIDSELKVLGYDYESYVYLFYTILESIKFGLDLKTAFERYIEMQISIIYHAIDIYIKKFENLKIVVEILKAIKKLFISAVFDADTKQEVLIMIKLNHIIVQIISKLNIEVMKMENQKKFVSYLKLLVDYFTKSQDFFSDKKTLMSEYIIKLYNYDFLTELEKKVTMQINSNVMLETNKWTSQTEFYLSNTAERAIPLDSIGRKYNVINPQIKLEMHENSYIPSAVYQGELLKKIFSALFEPNIGNTIILDIPNPKLLFTWTNFELYDVPTFRISNLPNIPFEDFTLEINSTYKFVINGKADDSSDNYEYLMYLSQVLGFNDAFEMEKNTTINRFNYSIADSSSSFISKKVNGTNTEPQFTYNNRIETFVKIMFDRNREIISRFMIGIDTNTIMQRLNIPEIKTIKLSCNNTKQINEITEKYLLNVYSINN